MNLEHVLVPAFTGCLVAWLAVSGSILALRWLYDRRSRPAREAARILADRGLLEPEREARLEAALARVPRRVLERVAADSDTPPEVARALARRALRGRHGARIAGRAAVGRGLRRRWDRVAALRVVALGGHPLRRVLLSRALGDPDPEIAAAAVTLLGQVAEPWAAELLGWALHRGLASPSRIAAQLDRFPLPIDRQVLRLLGSRRTSDRYWGASLAARCLGHDEVARLLVGLLDDPDAGIRKAAVASLAATGREEAVPRIAPLLDDPVGFVRAHAARALADLGRREYAPAVARCLADRDWWARLAAKEALSKLGADAAGPVLLAYLDHRDGFARNGAAEVLQNLGLLDELVYRGLAEGDRRALEHVRNAIAAGGVAILDGVVERVPLDVALRLAELAPVLGPAPEEEAA